MKKFLLLMTVAFLLVYVEAEAAENKKGGNNVGDVSAVPALVDALNDIDPSIK